MTYLMNYKQTVNIGEDIYTSYNKEYFNSWGIDFNIGIGVQFPLSEKIDLSVEAKYKKGLNNIESPLVEGPPKGHDKVTTSNALLLMGLHYKLQ